MAVLRGINFSDPVISPENNRDVEKSMNCRSSLFFCEHVRNSLSSSGAPNADCEMKIIIACARVYYASAQWIIYYDELWIWLFNFHMYTLRLRHVPFYSVLLASAIRLERDLYIVQYGKATISGSLVGWNAGNDWILNGGGGNWTKCIKSGQASSSRKWRDRCITYMATTAFLPLFDRIFVN